MLEYVYTLVTNINPKYVMKWISAGTAVVVLEHVNQKYILEATMLSSLTFIGMLIFRYYFSNGEDFYINEFE